MNRITNEQREAIVRKAVAERDSLLSGRAASLWQPFTEREPEALQVVLVRSEGWKFPKVLQFVPWGQQHRLYEVEGPERFYYYPERMRWLAIPHDSTRTP